MTLPNFTNKPQVGDKTASQPEEMPGGDNKQQPAPETETTQHEGNLSTEQWLRQELEKTRKEAAQRRIEAKEAKAKLDAMQRSQLEQAGQYQQLYESAKAELDAKALEIEATGVYRKAFEDMLNKRIEAIPEAMRGLVPADYDPLRLAQWLDQNAERLGARRFANLDAGAGSSGGGAGGKKADPRALDLARKLNIDPAKLIDK